MGCGCNKKKSQVVPSAASANTVVYDVADTSGSIVASYESIVLARSEARRVAGNVVPRTQAAGGTAAPAEMSGSATN